MYVAGFQGEARRRRETIWRPNSKPGEDENEGWGEGDEGRTVGEMSLVILVSRYEVGGGGQRLASPGEGINALP